MVSQTLFTIFVIALGGKKIHDLRRSLRNRTLLLKKGGRAHSNKHFPIIAAINITWLLSMVLEVWLFHRTIHWVLLGFMAFVFLFSQVLSRLAMKELGIRWTTDVITVPDLPPITSGIFRYLRHPNYLGVFLEILSAPLLHSAFITALVFTAINLWHLRIRVMLEEKALDQDSDYYTAFARRTRNVF